MVLTPMVCFKPAQPHLIGCALAACVLATFALPAAAKTPHAAHPPANAAGKMEKSLMKLDPTELATQVCDLSAMKALGRDAEYKKTDRVLIDAAETPKITGEKVTGEGGAFRMGDQWFRFGYTCTLASDHMSAVDFRYKVVGPIPEAKWAEFGLWH
ncbi:DUF930 domain-containing protein [Starkeya sp. ORNL1]|uniref:DUF930 domain-containing protein n=1 Tax=Starkeya sp. ORNL1 TaxID=2709380 RepID=UPI0014634A20|nr:DUF930 domain-containing protein [Starkeya sp. ORNL1]QJP13761.1 DUF930 domain-containing protein [Starkeya sp. ORNL1]